jgi:hypothetical protein
MKKILVSVFLVTVYTCTMAQNNSKNGHQITPETGDWGLGIDVDPLFRYVGNMFNGTMGQGGPSWEFMGNSPIPMTITGYMVKDENTAYRAKIRLGTGSDKRMSIIDRDGSTTIPVATVEDEIKTSATNILISGGIQKMRGKHRVKGLYGAEVLIGSGNGGKTTYEYGNSFNLDSTTIITPGTGAGYGMVTITDWSSGSGYSFATSSRTTESKTGSTFYIGIRGFIGVEYFLAPKVSIAGEFGWGLGLASTGEGETVTETFDSGTSVFANDDTIRTTTSTSGKSSTFGLDTDNGSPWSPSSGSLRMTFYF